MIPGWQLRVLALCEKHGPFGLYEGGRLECPMCKSQMLGKVLAREMPGGLWKRAADGEKG